MSESLEKQSELEELQGLFYFPRRGFDHLINLLVCFVLLLLLLSLLLGLLLLVHAVIEEHLGEVEGGPDGGEAVEQLLRLGDPHHAALQLEDGQGLAVADVEQRPHLTENKCIKA